MKKLFSILALTGLLVCSSCSDDFGDMNTRSDAVQDVNPAYFFSNFVQGALANYQRNVNLYPDFYSQYWSNTVTGFESPRYEYVDGWIGNQWREFYTENLTESLQINASYGESEYHVNAIAMNEIAIVYYWSRMTDTYGDIPYFGAGEGESVPYNSQQEIYYDLFERLDAAVKSLVNDPAQFTYGEYDHLYTGDVDQWRRFGNSLRLRLAMRLSNVDAAKAEAEVKAAIDGEGGLMTSNDDVARVGVWSNGWYDYLHQMAWYWDNIRASKTYTDYLYNQSSVGEDPRTPILFVYKVDGTATTKEDAGFAEYTGCVNGYDVIPAGTGGTACTINLDGGFPDFSGNEASEDLMYCQLMNYPEVEFLLAEAALRGWATGDANTHYKAGVQASMDYAGVEAAAATAYIDGLADLSGTNEEQLKQIITQKWLAGFPNGVEAWNDFRRTDYPDITLPVDGVSSAAPVAADTWVKRIRYPDNQHELNADNMPESLNSTDKDRMDVKVWWDVADTKTKSGGLMSSNF